jgi:hypothetical protein
MRFCIATDPPKTEHAKCHQDKAVWLTFLDQVLAIGLQLIGTVCTVTSSTMDLRMSLLPCARSRKTKAVIKLHTLLDLRGSIPAFIMMIEA